MAIFFFYCVGVAIISYIFFDLKAPPWLALLWPFITLFLIIGYVLAALFAIWRGIKALKTLLKPDDPNK